jgi:hypothetical protein
MLNAEEACGSPQKLDDFFLHFLTTLNVLRQLSAIFVFVLFDMQYKVRLGSKNAITFSRGGA